MRVERVPAGELRGLVPAPASLSEDVRRIVTDVRERGDAALQEYVERFDRQVEADVAELPGELRAALEVAIANVRTVAEAGLAAEQVVALPEGHTVTLREIPVRRAAIYAPGGRNPYPSTVVMGVVTAKVAGVEEVVVCAPGGHPVIAAAAELCGADHVYAMGGAHAVAALAYGTETIAPVDVIAGPGGPYVQEAKRLVSGDVGIDMYAGPSDLMVVADGDADAELVFADLAAQAEHGPGTVVALVSDSDELLERVGTRLQGLEGEAVAGLVATGDALGAIEAFAPEHLQLVGHGAERLAERVRSAGCVLVGRASGTAFTDYVAGSNHTLPTGGAARFASALNVRHFRRRMTEVHLDDAAAAALAERGATIADAEGFARHAQSMRIRQDQGL